MSFKDYAYDVLFKEESADDRFSYTLRVKKYRLKSYYPLVTVSINRIPLLANFDKLPDDYDTLCAVFEFRVRHSLSLQEQVNIGRRFLSENLLQQTLAFD